MMTRDSGRLPQGGDAQQAPCEASQSGHEVASPEPHRNPSSTPPPVTELLPCPRCRARATFYENKVDFVPKTSVRCAECDIDFDCCADTLSEAAEQWNARSNQEATPDADAEWLRVFADLWSDVIGGAAVDELLGIADRLRAKPVQEATRTVGDAELATLKRIKAIAGNVDTQPMAFIGTKRRREHYDLRSALASIINEVDDALFHTSSCGGR